MNIFVSRGDTSFSRRDRAAEQSASSIGPAQFGSTDGETHCREKLGTAASNVGELLVSALVVDGWSAFPGDISAARAGEMRVSIIKCWHLLKRRLST